MCELIKWINDNNGFLMIVITAIYVIATIFICIFNGKSASASRKQLEEMKVQQKQNTGIQLYEKRKIILAKFSDDKFNDIFWDIPILFDGKINDEFIAISSSYNHKSKLFGYLRYFEQHLQEIYGKEIYEEFQYLEANDNSIDSDKTTTEILYSFCDKYSFSEYDPVNQETIEFDYRKISEELLKINKLFNAKKTELFLEMQQYIKDSIQ